MQDPSSWIQIQSAGWIPWLWSSKEARILILPIIPRSYPPHTTTTITTITHNTYTLPPTPSHLVLPGRSMQKRCRMKGAQEPGQRTPEAATSYAPTSPHVEGSSGPPGS